MLTPDKIEWLNAVLGVSVTEEDLKGVVTKAKGTEYEGEEHKAGWRGRMTGISEDDTDVVTQHLTDEERAANTIAFDQDNKASTPYAGTAKGSTNYAVDPKTGDMVIETEGARIRELDSDGNPTSFTSIAPTGTTGEKVRKMREMGGNKRLEVPHHTTMLRGADVLSAGTVTFDDGKLTKITNDSGHYKPQFVHLLQVVEMLTKQGVLLKKEIVDYEGDSVEENYPKAFALYKKTLPALAALPKDKARLVAVNKMLASDDIDADQLAPLAAEGAALAKKLTTLNKVMIVFRQMGIGPSQQFDESIKVEFKTGDEDAGAIAFRTGGAKEMTAREFMMGEGSADLQEQDDDDEDDEDAAALAAYYMGEDDGPKRNIAFRGTGGYLGPTPDAPPAAVEAAAPEETEGPASKIKHRDATHRSALMDEIKEVGRERNLRPEDRDGDLSGVVSNGEAPEVDEDAWEQAIDALLVDMDTDYPEQEEPQRSSDAGAGQVMASSAGSYIDEDDDDSDDDDDDIGDLTRGEDGYLG